MEQVAYPAVRQSFASGGVDKEQSVVRFQPSLTLDLHDPCSLGGRHRTPHRKRHLDGVPKIAEARRIQERGRHLVLHEIDAQPLVLGKAVVP
jgi:hypothetical protein